MKMRISMTTRKELTAALRARYRSATFGDQIKMPDELVALTGYHRKHVIRVLGEQAAGVFMTKPYGKRSRCCGRPLIMSAVSA
jgi:hypothetical protein